MLAGTVTKDNHSKVVSLEKRRQEIQRRIGNLEDRITGTRKSNIVVKHNDQNKVLDSSAHQFTLSDNLRAKGIQMKRSYVPESAAYVKKQPQQDIGQLYSLLKSTLEGQAKLQQELRMLRQDMNNMAVKDRQKSSPYLKEHRNIDAFKKQSASPADRLYSNENRENAGFLGKSGQLNKSEIATTPFWQNQSSKPFQTAHFNNNGKTNEGPSNPPSITYQPPSTKRNRQSVTGTSRYKQLNFSQQNAKIYDPSKLTIDSPIKLKPKRRFSGRRSNRSKSNNNNPSNKSTIRSPKGILKNVCYVPPMTHYEDLRKFYGMPQTENVNQTCFLEDNSKSMRKSSKKYRKIEFPSELKSIIAEKIQKRLIESKETFIDSTHKNAKHQHDHLTNTVELQKKLRQDMLKKIHQMRDTKRYK